MKIFEGQLRVDKGDRFAFVAARFNEFVVDRLVGMGMKVDTEQLATSPMRLVALKLAKGEKGKVMPWRNKGIRVIPKEQA